MHILPRSDFRINSGKSPEEISDLLKSVTSPGRFPFCLSADTAFTGEVTASGFRIIRRISYRNSFLPVITGTIKAEDDGSVIDIRMRLHPFVRIFLAWWFGMAGFFFLTGLLLILTAGIREAWLLLFAAVFLIFGQILVRCGFYIPAGKVVSELKKLLE